MPLHSIRTSSQVCTSACFFFSFLFLKRVVYWVTNKTFTSFPRVQILQLPMGSISAVLHRLLLPAGAVVHHLQKEQADSLLSCVPSQRAKPQWRLLWWASSSRGVRMHNVATQNPQRYTMTNSLSWKSSQMACNLVIFDHAFLITWNCCTNLVMLLKLDSMQIFNKI